MTKVDFYVLRSAQPHQRLEVAVRLSEKAFLRGRRVYINAADESQARSLDELLWSQRPASFLPHGAPGSTPPEDIAIGWGQEPADHNDVLINLQLSIPPFFSRFQRVLEVVTQDTDSLGALRASWTFYRERGYELEKHDL